jgi:ribosomal protein S26
MYCMSCIVYISIYKVRKAEVHTSGPLVPDSSSFDVQIAI